MLIALKIIIVAAAMLIVIAMFRSWAVHREADQRQTLSTRPIVRWPDRRLRQRRLLVHRRDTVRLQTVRRHGAGRRKEDQWDDARVML